MTIKELEVRTGMNRANIRFYEEEGLLAPQRRANGYRDYSEEDVRTLEKIRLLRQLQLDLGTIRMVQQGELSLERALFTQLNRLEGDRALLQRAAEVCREIERSGVDYHALEPAPWLAQLEASAQERTGALNAPGKPPCKPSPEELHYLTHRACEHPWMRLFARGMDFALCKFLFLTLFLLVFRWHGCLKLAWLWRTLFDIGIYCVSILLEPFWLHYVGWTPGKWIFGLKLRDKNGEKLSLSQARSRAWRVAWEGDGLYIPFYNLWRNWKSYKCCADHEDCWWDVYESCRYTREERKWYGLWWAGETAVYLALVLLIAAACLAPPHRNGLTVREFCRNYNDRAGIYQADAQYRLSSDGLWRSVVSDAGNMTISVDVDGTWLEVTGQTRWLDPEFTVEEGEVTAVTFTMESDRTVLSGRYGPERMGLFAFTGAVEGTNLLRYDGKAWEQAWRDWMMSYGPWDNFEESRGGIRITQTVELRGYKPYGNGGLAALGGEKPLCVRRVTFSLERE